MKNLKLCVLVSALLGLAGAGAIYGDDQASVSVDALRAPTSPALVLTGLSPSAIEGPETPTALFATIAGALSERREIAIGVAPYWMTSHPSLSFEKFARPDALQALIQNATLSFLYDPIASGQSTYAFGAGTVFGPFGATVDPSMDEYATTILVRRVWQMALVLMQDEMAKTGFSAEAFGASLQAKTEEAIAGESRIQAESRARVEALRDAFLDGTRLYDKPGDVETLRLALGQELETNEKESQNGVVSWQELRAARKGLAFVIAGALSLVSVSGDIKDSSLAGEGAWVTLLYPFKGFDGLACLRWIRSGMQSSTVDNLDAGIRFLYSTERAQAGCEGLLRWLPQASDLRYRLACTLKYDEPSLGVLDISAGKDFGDAGSASSSQWFLGAGITIGGESRISLLR